LDTILTALMWLDSLLGGSLYFPWLLLGIGLFFSFYLDFPQFRWFAAAWRLFHQQRQQRLRAGETTPWQAFATALSGTIGTGNISGVALAIHLGGSGAVFWMWLTAFLGMVLKYVEVMLSHRYREVTPDGIRRGGPMYVLSRRLNRPGLAAWFAFAVLLSAFGIGSMPQSNMISHSLWQSWQWPPAWVGCAFTLLLALVILGGVQRIAKVTVALVPLMAMLYIFASLSVLVMHWTVLPQVVWQIVTDALTGSAAQGGFLGAGMAYGFNRGINRGLFSNEAGSGTSAIIHATTTTEEPVAEGLMAMLEPFIDTLIICTLTALVVLSTQVWYQKQPNTFEHADVLFVEGHFDDRVPADITALQAFLSQRPGNIRLYDGLIDVIDGHPMSSNFTILAARSVAESVVFLTLDNTLFSGVMTIKKGHLVTPDIKMQGRSLLHSTGLTLKAFQQGYWGQGGQWMVIVSLVLFAFSTSISWAFYGDQAVLYLWGERALMPYRWIYIFSFLGATVMDTTLIWHIGGICVVLMTLPNLYAMWALRREVQLMKLDYSSTEEKDRNL
jgi:alanine or glycine:cation symporter, AGCS family